MNRNDYINIIRKPITEDLPLGEQITEDRGLDFIESEIMRVGTLAHGKIKWEEIEQVALNLLETKTKDLKIISALLQAIQHRADSKSLVLSLEILFEVLNSYWDSCFPTPSKKGNSKRNSLFTSMMKRALHLSKKITNEPIDKEQKAELKKVLDKIAVKIESYKLPQGDFKKMSEILLIMCETPVQEEPSVGKEVKLPVKQKEPTSVKKATSTSRSNVSMNNDKEIKTGLLQISENISNNSSENVLGDYNRERICIYLRRFSTWFSLTSCPDLDEEGNSELLPPSEDRIKEYEVGLQTEPNYALWHKVEQSTVASPFWIDGHYLSARIALALKQENWAISIKEETRIFLQRIPQLHSASFKGGLPFISESTARWLNQDQIVPHKGTAQTYDHWSIQKEAILSKAELEGPWSAIQTLNEQLLLLKEPREKFLSQLFLTEIFHKYKITALATYQFSELLEQAQRLTLESWDPSLFKYLQYAVTKDQIGS